MKLFDGLLLALPAGDPPTELRILANGVTETSKGPVLFDAKAGELVMQAFGEHGQDLLPFDVGHGMVNPFSPPDGHKAAGWFRPEVREDGLWASDIEWTEMGESGLRKREFRFFSPALYQDRTSGRVNKLVNIALTNLPATKGQRPLVAHDAGEPQQPARRGNIIMDEFLKLLGVSSEVAGLSRVTELLRTNSELRALTGANDDATALSAVRGLKDESLKLATQVATLQGEKTAAKRDQVIARLSQEGKLPPALHDWAKTQTVESLEAFSAGMPALPVSQSQVPAPAAGGVITLSAEERAVAQQLGLDPQTLIEEKRRQLAAAV